MEQKDPSFCGMQPASIFCLVITLLFHDGLCSMPKQRKNKSGITLKSDDNDGIIIIISNAMMHEMLLFLFYFRYILSPLVCTARATWSSRHLLSAINKKIIS